jgi:non-haem Fe2+, alpha-ketoglutarate-dependent halogenase
MDARLVPVELKNIPEDYVGVERSTQTAQQFHQNGILFPVSVLATEEVSFYRTALSGLQRRLNSSIERLPSLHEYFPWAYDLSVHPKVLQAVQEVLGPEIVHWGTLVLCKPSHSPVYASWHQDGEYAAFLNGAPSVSAWIALTDSTAESGCMRVLPGSHTHRVEHRLRLSSQNLLKMGQTAAVDVDEAQVVNVELKAGQMSLHHVDIIHGSKPNSSDHDRTGFIIRFTTPEIRPGTAVVRASCSPSACSHLRLILRPADPAKEEAFQAYEAFLRSPEQSRRLGTDG